MSPLAVISSASTIRPIKVVLQGKTIAEYLVVSSNVMTLKHEVKQQLMSQNGCLFVS